VVARVMGRGHGPCPGCVLPLGVGMSPWWWVLVGLAAWLTPGVLVVLMLGWVLWRDPEKPPKHRKPP